MIVSFICMIFIFALFQYVGILIIFFLDKNNGIDSVIDDVMTLILVLVIEIILITSIAISMMGGLDAS